MDTPETWYVQDALVDSTHGRVLAYHGSEACKDASPFA